MILHRVFFFFFFFVRCAWHDPSANQPQPQDPRLSLSLSLSLSLNLLGSHFSLFRRNRTWRAVAASATMGNQQPGGKDQDTSGFDPVTLAAYRGDAEALETALRQATKKGTVKDVLGRGKDGRAPLHWACINGHAACVEVLLEHGARVNMTDKNDHSTAIATAVHGGFRGIVKLLIDGGLPDRGCAWSWGLNGGWNLRASQSGAVARLRNMFCVLSPPFLPFDVALQISSFH